MAETPSHKRAKGAAAGRRGKTEVPLSRGRHQGHHEKHVGNKETIRLIVEKNAAYIFLTPCSVSGNGER